MSIYSDYKVGALTDEEYRWLCSLENRKERRELENDEIEEREDEYDEREVGADIG